jgi:hypothetical protein
MKIRPLIQIIRAILNDDDQVPELPDDNLCLFGVGGTLVYRTVPENLFLQVARFQTLIERKREIVCGDRHFDLLKGEGCRIGQSFFVAMSNAEAVNGDTDSVISTLEVLIMECVRDLYPHEYDFCYFYRVDYCKCLYRKEIPAPCLTN